MQIGVVGVVRCGVVGLAAVSDIAITRYSPNSTQTIWKIKNWKLDMCVFDVACINVMQIGANSAASLLSLTPLSILILHLLFYRYLLSPLS